MSDNNIVELDASRPADANADPFAPRKTDAGTVFRLRKPFLAHAPGGPRQLTELTLREPNSEDYFAGGPITTMILHGVRVGEAQKTEMRIDPAAVRTWISRLSGLDGGIIGQMGLRDMMVISAWLQAQFGDEDRTQE